MLSEYKNLVQFLDEIFKIATSEASRDFRNQQVDRIFKKKVQPLLEELEISLYYCNVDPLEYRIPELLDNLRVINRDIEAILS